MHVKVEMTTKKNQKKWNQVKEQSVLFWRDKSSVEMVGNRLPVTAALFSLLQRGQVKTRDKRSWCLTLF
jgi:hypothetical protein